jgi:DNA-binding transcriptional MerR regulator
MTERGGINLNRRLYSTGQFAIHATVTRRTLRYYDRVGLLHPRQHTESGYRLYSDDDLVRLQQILGLKYLGFSLQEIKACLDAGPQQMVEVLTQQKAMLSERRRQLDAIYRALDEAERLASSGAATWDSVTSVIRLMQMEQNNEEMKQHLTPEQREKMRELFEAAYSSAAQQELAKRLAAAGDPQSPTAQEARSRWFAVATEAQRLAATGADPAHPEAQALAMRKLELIAEFSQGNAEIESGVQKLMAQLGSLPEDAWPLSHPQKAPIDSTGAAFLDRAVAIYKETGG